MVTPKKGVYDALTLNAEGRRVGDTWDPSRDEAAGEACRAYGAGNIMRMPTRVQITWTDDRTLRIETDAGKQVRTFNFVGGGPLQVTQQLATGGDYNLPDARRQPPPCAAAAAPSRCSPARTPSTATAS